MSSTHTPQSAPNVSRREAVRRMAVVGAGLTAGLVVGCTPLRIGLAMYPHRYDTDRDIGNRVLRAFVTTVIPGVRDTTPDLIRVYEDDYYPLTPYRGYLIYDLCERADRLFDTKLFSDLDAGQRIRVLQDALSADKTTRRLYEGAIFLAQISCYAGIHDDAGGCELIDFQGASGILPLAEQTYPAPERYFARRLTADGNYA